MLASILPLCLLLLFSSASPATATSSAYDVLRDHGLPMGLLPKGIEDFSIDGEGRFVARLRGPCTAKFESQMRYNASVSGVISVGQIAGLSGVDAQDLFLWFPVHAIRLDSDTLGIIHFDVGVVDKRFPRSLFDVPPDCFPVSLEGADKGVVDASKEGSDIALLLPKSQSGKLGFKLDKDDLQTRADS